MEKHFELLGSSWYPTSQSGKFVLITSLVFAMIIYNSYAAYITSVLSINAPSIRNLDDIFDHNFDIGFLRNSQDEIFLMVIDHWLFSFQLQTVPIFFPEHKRY